ncbi:hypothetical protein DIPPA_08435 [Diplonema papillatum]|nr:hypothetical protein DIPPA_08435 [Diplonema papillatum]
MGCWKRGLSLLSVAVWSAEAEFVLVGSLDSLADASRVVFSDTGDVGLLQDGLAAKVLLTAGVPNAVQPAGAIELDPKAAYNFVSLALSAAGKTASAFDSTTMYQFDLTTAATANGQLPQMTTLSILAEVGGFNAICQVVYGGVYRATVMNGADKFHQATPGAVAVAVDDRNYVYAAHEKTTNQLAYSTLMMSFFDTGPIVISDVATENIGDIVAIDLQVDNSNRLLYLSHSAGVSVYDVQSTTGIAFVTTVALASVTGIIPKNGLLYISTATGLYSYDMSVSTNPVMVASTPLQGVVSNGLWVTGDDVVYVTRKTAIFAYKDLPSTQAPLTQSPATDAPATDRPATRAPDTNPPVTETPSSPSPPTGGPGTGAPPSANPSTVPATAAPVSRPPLPPPVADNLPPRLAQISVSYPSARVMIADVGAAVALSAASTLNSANAVSNTRVVMAAQNCRTATQQQLPRLLHPTQLVVDGSPALGAVVGNLGLMLTCGGLCYLSLRFAETHGQRLFPSIFRVDDVQGFLRFPAVPLFCFQLLFQGTVLAGLSLLVQSRAKLSHCVAGGSALVTVLGLAAYIFKSVRKAIPLRAKYLAYKGEPEVASEMLSGSGVWVSMQRATQWVNRFASVVRQYRQETVWFVFIEMLASAALAAMQAIETDSPTTCGHVKLFSSFIFMILCGLEAYVWPHARERDSVISIVQLGAQSSALVFMSKGLYNGVPGHWTFHVSSILMLSSIVLSGMRVVLDVGAAMHTARSGRVQAMQESAFLSGTLAHLDSFVKVNWNPAVSTTDRDAETIYSGWSSIITHAHVSPPVEPASPLSPLSPLLVEPLLSDPAFCDTLAMRSS